MTNTQNINYAKFKVSDVLDEPIAGNVDIQKKDISDEGEIVVTSGLTDYGIKGRTTRKAKVVKEPSITIDMFGNVFYRDEPYKLVTHGRVYGFTSKLIKNREIGLYLVSVLRPLGAKFSYNNMMTWSKLKDLSIELPVAPSGTPDFEYMEERIRELEEERIRELEAYLKVTGLSDATLTKADQDALDKMNMGGVKWKKFKIGDLFERTALPRKIKQFKKKRDVSTEMTHDFDLPLVNSKVGNNGIMYYGKSEQWNAAKLTIDIIQDGAVGAGMVYAQPDSTGVLYNAYLINWKNNQEPINAKHILFFASSLRKVLYGTYNYQRKATWDRVQDDFISLPVTSSGNIDFDFMENYITAIEKQSIRGVIEYKDKVIQTIKDVVNAN